MADVDDRWFKTVKHPDGTTAREKTSRHGVGKRWVARWRDDQGEQRKRSFERKTDAERFLSGIQSDLARAAYVDPSAGKVTFRSYAEQWLAGQVFEASTRESVRKRLGAHAYPVLGPRELRVLANRPSIIQSWLGDLSTRLAPATVRGTLAHVSAVFAAAVDDRLIVRNPCAARSVKRPALTRRHVTPWTAEQAADVLGGMPDRYRVAGLLAAGCGLRQGEVFGLALQDVDFLGRVLHVRRQVRIVEGKMVFALPKGGRERSVPLPETVGLALSAHIAAFPPAEVTLPWRETDGRPDTARLLVTTRQAGAVNRNVFNRHAWKPALAAAGLTDSRENGMHACRHFYASVLLDGGESIKALSEYLGHHDAGFTLRTYTHLMPSSEERTRKAVDGALGSACDPDVTRRSV